MKYQNYLNNVLKLLQDYRDSVNGVKAIYDSDKAKHDRELKDMQVKARGFRRLRTGQAKEELLHNFENAESGLYRNGMQKYSNNNFTSTVEKIALSKYELKEEYEKRLAEMIHCES